METLNNRLRRLRLAAGFSQKALAKRIGVSGSTYRDWEYGKNITGEPYLRIAKALNLSLTELMTGEKNAVSELEVELRAMEHRIENIRKIVASL